MDGDEELGRLILCSFCYNAYHPKCAGLKPGLKRKRHDWACPECVHVAEEALQLDPVHVDSADDFNLADTGLVSSSHTAAELDDDNEYDEPTKVHRKMASVAHELSA